MSPGRYYFDKVSTGTVCPFPFAFDPKDLKEFGEKNLTADNCTKTFGEVLDPVWGIFQGVILFVFGCIFLPMTILQLYRTFKFAETKKLNVYGTIQFKLYTALLLFVLFVIIEHADPYGFRNAVSPLLYVVFDELAPSAAILLALLIIDFFGKTAEGSLNAQGMPRKVYLFFMIVTVTFFLGMEMLAVSLDNDYLLINGVKKIGICFIVVLILVYTRKYVNSIVSFLDAQAEFQVSSKNMMTYRSPGTTSADRSKTKLSVSSGTNEPGSNSDLPVKKVNPALLKKTGARSKNESCLDYLFAGWIPERKPPSYDQNVRANIKRNNSTSANLQLRFDVSGTGNTLKNNSSLEAGEKDNGMMQTICCCCPKKNVTPGPKNPARELERKYRKLQGVLIFVLVLYIGLAAINVSSDDYQWAFSVDDTSLLISYILVKIFYMMVAAVVIHMFPVPKTKKKFFEQYQLKVSGTKTQTQEKSASLLKVDL